MTSDSPLDAVTRCILRSDPAFTLIDASDRPPLRSSASSPAGSAGEHLAPGKPRAFSSLPSLPAAFPRVGQLPETRPRHALVLHRRPELPAYSQARLVRLRASEDHRTPRGRRKAISCAQVYRSSRSKHPHDLVSPRPGKGDHPSWRSPASNNVSIDTCPALFSRNRSIDDPSDPSA